MTDLEYKELLKLSVENLKDKTILKLLEHDTLYQDDAKKLDHAELQYMHLDLTDAQKEICNDFFKYKDKVDFEYGTHAYMAGLIDAFRIILVLFPDIWESEKLKILNAMTIQESNVGNRHNTSEVKEQGEAETP